MNTINFYEFDRVGKVIDGIWANWRYSMQVSAVLNLIEEDEEES